MTTYIAFLRGINVGGNVIVPMKDLVKVAEGIGFQNVRTYINSGNVIFESPESEGLVQEKLETALEKKWKRKIAVMIRTGKELKSIVAKNPFPKAEPSKVGVTLFSEALPKNFLENFDFTGPEELICAKRELYVHYPNGMGQSKLKLPKTAEQGTVRNMNTIRKLVELAGAH